MAVQNYEVAIHLFGEWPRGTVLPEFAVRWAGPVAELVERAVVRATAAPVPKAVSDRLAELARGRAAAAAPAPAVPDAVSAELEQLRGALAAATEAAAVQAALAERGEQRGRDLAASLAEYVEANAHLTRACADHQATIDALRAELADLKALDAATAPGA
jgi:hypothetical protein